jgi:hypothetical protein
MGLPTFISTTIPRAVCLSKSGGLNLDGIYFASAHAHDDSYGTAADFAVDNKFRAAFNRVERNLEIFPAMRTGDCQEFTHESTVTYATDGSLALNYYVTKPVGSQGRWGNAGRLAGVYVYRQVSCFVVFMN